MLPGNAAQWYVAVNGTDIPAVDMLERGDETPMVNIMTIAPMMRMSVSGRGGNSLQLVDKAGTCWQTTHGDISLTSDDRAIPLTMPAFIQGGLAYLPAQALAEVAGLAVVVDTVNHRIAFTQTETQSTDVNTESGVVDSPDWQAFSLAKTPGEMAAITLPDVVSSKPSPLRVNPLYQPPQDLFRWGVGLGYAQRGNLNIDVNGNGMINGLKANFGASLTDIWGGARLQAMRGSLRDEESGWQVDVGDICSDINGNVRGMRYTRRIAQQHWPAVMLFTRDTPGDKGKLLLALQDDYSISPSLSLGGELVSDRSYFLRGQYTPSNWSISGFHREQPEQNIVASGVYFSRALGNRISLTGGINHSKADGKLQDWRNLSLNLPLVHAVNLMFDVSLFADETSSNTIYAAMLSMPVGPVQLQMRYQWNHNSQQISGPSIFRIDTANQNMNVSAHYAATPRLNFDYQVTAQQNANGDQGGLQQLVSSYRISPRTQLQVVSAFPHFTDPEHLLLRLTQSLNNGNSVVLDYGNKSGTSGTGLGFNIMLRKEWGIKTAARGGEVSGRVTDLFGQPAPSIEVLLGAYQTRTDTNGRYKFTRVPPGDYTIHLDETSLPATLHADKVLNHVTITRRSREIFDFHVIPLNSITGHVYLDRNDNGRQDAGEGVKLAVLRLNASATCTDDSGLFRFYNLPPGKLVVRLDITKLSPDMTPGSPVEVTIQLEENNTISGLEFRLRPVEKQTVFQTLN